MENQDAEMSMRNNDSAIEIVPCSTFCQVYRETKTQIVPESWLFLMPNVDLRVINAKKRSKNSSAMFQKAVKAERGVKKRSNDLARKRTANTKDIESYVCLITPNETKKEGHGNGNRRIMTLRQVEAFVLRNVWLLQQQLSVAEDDAIH
ncbi:hypothetical protein CEXT_69841 [Caerostris extrusa]|uniref:Uncharacterized protein n=1 Tax=Caerostris extrusa TaxID=172846 RepID=A0AAV4UGP4_CAEEX|nr:hypothetical protein CEXT_69841 [Caerostris extrusa]